MATPLEILIALWYHCRQGDYGVCGHDNNFNAPAVQDVFARFLDAGLLAVDGGSKKSTYRAGEGLAVYVKALCSIPFPVRQWVIPNSDAV